MRLDEIKALVEGTAPAIAEAIDNRLRSVIADVDALRRENAELRARVAAVEASPLRYDGPYETGKSYERGTFVTCGGSVWHANRDTNVRPGQGPSWTLAVKAGRDAR